MFLGIEIGGTKLQVGVGTGEGPPLTALLQAKVEPRLGAEGIRAQIAALAQPLVAQHGIRAVGIGFGGPVEPQEGRAIKSHQIAGWDLFPLTRWATETFGCPCAVGNDADVAGLAEAHYGAGRDEPVVAYLTVGSGIGGALIINGQIYSGAAGVASEIGHLRLGLQAEQPDQTVESIASGWGIAAAARERLTGAVSHTLLDLAERGRGEGPEEVRERIRASREADQRDVDDLLRRCGRAENLTTAMLAEAAMTGNHLAQNVFARAYQALGWAIAQMITLTAPSVVVIGGGVSLMGEEYFFFPLREEVDRYVFPPLAGSYRILPAQLGEEVVVHGAVALAAQRFGRP